MINPRAALLAVVLTTSACASQLSGHGSASTPSSAATSPSSSSHAQPLSLLRVAPVDQLGDPVTTDFCHGITLSAFDQWGEPFLHPYQLADACFIDVLDGSNDLLVDIISYPTIPILDPAEPAGTMAARTR